MYKNKILIAQILQIHDICARVARSKSNTYSDISMHRKVSSRPICTKHRLAPSHTCPKIQGPLKTKTHREIIRILIIRIQLLFNYKHNLRPRNILCASSFYKWIPVKINFTIFYQTSTPMSIVATCKSNRSSISCPQTAIFFDNTPCHDLYHSLFFK